MTVEELFANCANVFGQSMHECEIWKDGFLGMVNSILAECFPLENGIRKNKKQQPLEQPQIVNTFSDVLVYDPQLLHSCVLWGVSTLLAVGDDDNVRAGYFESKYEGGKLAALRGDYVETEDCY